MQLVHSYHAVEAYVSQDSLYAQVRRPGKVLREEKGNETRTEIDECHPYCVLNISDGRVKEVKPGQLSEISQNPAFINLLQESGESPILSVSFIIIIIILNEKLYLFANKGSKVKATNVF